MNAPNLTWHHGEVTPEHRAQILGQRGATLWFTGLSGSGKSTVAVALEQALTQRGRLAYRLDGDNVRHGLCANLGFGPEDRDENIRRIGEVAKLFADAGALCLCSFVSPYRDARQRVRNTHQAASPPLPFFEVFVDVPVEVAEQRDPKGLYEKARAGKIPEFTGVSAPFEAPETPELHLPTHELPLAQSVQKLLTMLEAAGVIPPAENASTTA
ncbi:MAG: adenylyl-sulfate kinase [Planctomycetota bacterium]